MEPANTRPATPALAETATALLHDELCAGSSSGHTAAGAQNALSNHSFIQDHYHPSTQTGPAHLDQPEQYDEELDPYPVPVLTRRHSVPASYVFNTFLALWNSNGGEGSSESNINNPHQEYTRPGAGEPADSEGKNKSAVGPSETAIDDDQQHQQQNTSSSSSQKASKGSVNRHRYGHRHNKSVALDQPVIVKAYDPKLDDERMNRHALDEDEYDKIKLPPVDAFSFNGLMKAVKPQVDTARDSLANFSSRYRENLKTETDVLDRTQKGIEDQMREADSLAAKALKASNDRNKSISSDLKELKEGAAIEELAQCAERTYTALESILSTLIAIDEMLPAQDRLSLPSSSQKSAYPLLSTLVTRKAEEINIRFSQYARRNSVNSQAAPPTPTSPSRHHVPPSPHSPFPTNPPLTPSFANRRFSAASYASQSSTRETLPPQLIRTISPSSPIQSPTLQSPRLVRSSTFSHDSANIRPRTSTDIRPRLQIDLKKRRGTFMGGLSGWWSGGWEKPWGQGSVIAEEESAEDRLRRLVDGGLKSPPVVGNGLPRGRGKGKNAANRRSVAL